MMLKNLFKHDSATFNAIRLIRHIKIFWDTYSFLKKSQWLSHDELNEYQLRQLDKLLRHAYQNVPYYRRLFDERGLTPGDIGGLDDLRKIPFLTREIVRENLDGLKAVNYRRKRLECVTTGGSTGVPLSLYYEKGVSRIIEWAFTKALWDRVGHSFRDKCLVLRGGLVKSAARGKYWEYSLLGRRLVLSSYHMNEQNLPEYIDRIRKFKPRFIHAFPSTISLLAQYMREHNIEPFPTVRAILCGSEMLYPWQRKLVEDVFGCRLYSWYGHMEMGALAGECEVSTRYHISPEYGIVELIRQDGRPVTGEGEVGEIVTTGFNNRVLPLLRYRTQDLAVLSNKKCQCGRDYTLLESIEGRLQDLIVTKNGDLVRRVSLYDEEWRGIKQIQFLQEKPGEVIILVVRDASFAEAEIKRQILRTFELQSRGQYKLEVRFVDHIPRTRSGKYLFFVQKLPIKFGKSEG